MISNLKFLIFLVLLLIKTNKLNCDSSLSDNDLYFIEQSIDGNEFKEIGSLNLRLIKQNQNAAQYQSLNTEDEQKVVNPNLNIFSTQIESKTFDRETLNQIESSLSSNNTIYRLRLCKKIPTQKCYSSSFTNLKNLIESSFRLNLSIHTGANNRLNGISIKTSTILTNKNNKNQYDHLTMYVYVQNIRQGQQPDTETYLEKLKIEREQKERGSQADNQSFLSKYWMFIVPFVVIMFLTTIVNPEAGGR